MSNKKSGLEKTKKLSVTAILSAIVIIVSFLPLKTLGLEINFSMVPIAIGAMLYGPATGAILGLVFGVVSFIQCFGYSGFGMLLLNQNWFATLMVCIPTRVLAGFLTGLIFKCLNSKGTVCKNISYPVASLAAPFLNTLLFMTTLVLFFYKSDLIQGYVTALGAANPFVFIILFVGINGLVEIIAGFVVAYPASRAIKHSLKI